MKTRSTGSRGELLLNGLFGVSKQEYHEGFEIRRLIMNLIPLNAVCKGMDGDVSTLPSWSSMGALQLHPDEDLVVSSEDVKCFFYIFRVPPEWHPFLAFNRVLPSSLCGPRPGRYFMASVVLPMGFKNSVSLAQHVHRYVVKQALSHTMGTIGLEGEIRKDKTFPRKDWLFRVYLDNFDELRKVNKVLSEAVEGKVSPLVVGLREEYLKRNIPRHPKKSVSQSVGAEVQGAIVDGRAGVAYPKPEKVLRYCQLGCLLLQQRTCTQRQLQVIGGGFVYMAMFRRPLLGCLNAIWQAIVAFEGYPPCVRMDIPVSVKREVARFISLVPLAAVSFRHDIDAVVSASDASEYGGGVTVSRGLTEAGSMAASCAIRGDVVEPNEVPAVLSVGLFDGISALRVALDALQWNCVGHISVETSQAAQRVVESRFPAALHFPDVTAVDESVVQNWACRFGQVCLVLLGAGPPCQGVSGLNVDRKGALKDQRSNLFVHVGRVRQLLARAFPWARVATLMESVASMDPKDMFVMSQDYGDKPFLVDAKDFSIGRRPRVYWLDWELCPEQDFQVKVNESPDLWGYHEVQMTAVVDPSAYLTSGWQKVSDDPFPTFTTSRCREHPGRRPAGLHACQSHEVARWVDDGHRYPPYQYQDKHCVTNHNKRMRVPNVEEREVILGFPRGYTLQCLPKSRHGSDEHLATRLTLLGNTWSVPVIVWLLGHLGRVLGFHEYISGSKAVELTAPGSVSNLHTFLQRPTMTSSRTTVHSTQGALELVGKLCSLVSLKGEDLLLQSQNEEVVRYHRLRASLPARLWKWGTVASWRWKGTREHINVLEMRAALCALRWRLDRTGKTRSKIVHLVDSLVVLHSLSRGRSSSVKLRRTLLRVNSLLRATGSQAVWAYVHTGQNPADRPSRRPVKKKWKNA